MVPGEVSVKPVPANKVSVDPGFTMSVMRDLPKEDDSGDGSRDLTMHESGVAPIEATPVVASSYGVFGL